MPTKYLIAAIVIGGAVIVGAFLSGCDQVTAPSGSLTAEVERISGLTLPAGVQLLYERDEHDSFLGDGVVVRAFATPGSDTTATDHTCPSGFTWDSLIRVGALAPDIKLLHPQPTHACILTRDAGPNRTDLVVITGDRMFHVGIDL